MKERGQQLFSELTENIDFLTSNGRNLSLYVEELEELVEEYRLFASQVQPSTADDLVAKVKLLARTQEVIGPPPEKPPVRSESLPEQ